MKTQTLSKAAEAYLEFLKGQGKSENTVYTYGMDFKQMQGFFGEDRPLDKILPAQVGKFLKSDELLKIPKSGRKRAKPTVDKTIRVMRMFFLWAVETGRLKAAPLPKEGVPMGHSVPKAEAGNAAPAKATKATAPARKAKAKPKAKAAGKAPRKPARPVSADAAAHAEGEQGSGTVAA